MSASSFFLNKSYFIMTGVRPFPCTFENCSKAFKMKREMVTHIRRMHKVKPYECESCDESFFMKLELMEHVAKCAMKLEDEEGQESSMESGNYVDSEGNNESTDTRNHHSRDDLKCKYCNKLFSRNCLLQRHIFLHTGEFQNMIIFGAFCASSRADMFSNGIYTYL